jgi:hypothetical protein
VSDAPPDDATPDGATPDAATPDDPTADDARPQLGWRHAVLVLGIVLDVVLVGASITLIVPPLRDVVLHTPITIVVLVAGTAIVLWRLASRPPAS